MGLARTGTRVVLMSRKGRNGHKSKPRRLALDIGCSYREVAQNCHVDPDGHDQSSEENDE